MKLSLRHSVYLPQSARSITNPPLIARLILTCGLGLLLTACQNRDDEVATEIRPVRVITIADRTSSGTLTLIGSVQAQTEINHSFRIDGRMIERYVNVGNEVRPGQLVARLDPANEESSLQSARAQLTAAQAQLIEAQSNNTRMTELVAESAVSQADFDRAVALLQTAQAQVESAQAQVRLAQNRLDYTQLFAKAAGVVTSRGPEAGEVVSAGRMIIQVAREGSRDAVFGVPAQVKDSADANSPITVSLTSDPRVTATGRVREVSPRADPITGTFTVRVELSDPPPTMRLGSTVTGRIQSDATVGIEIPASALVRADGRSAVWVVDPENQTVSMRTIEVQAQNPASVQVASGLNPGDLVVTAGVQALRPEQKVRPLESDKP
jgi:RND family efflux transporter MFP subunit